MKMICEVPDEVIKCIMDGTWCGRSVAEKMIANGIPLSSSEEPCEDAISRQAVLVGLANIAKAKARSDAQKALMGRIMFFTEQLPPVTPQPKMGHWIFDEVLDRHYYCSECKTMGVDYWDYCPNCGAKMQEVKDNG